MAIKKYENDQERVDAAWQKLAPLLREKKQPPGMRKVFAIAASLFLISALAIFLWSNDSRMVVYSTGYGETLSVVLPDSSVVILNGNTKLSVPERWPAKGDRDVHVEGEAYFSIRHTQTDQKFFVSMDDNSAVEVLGTEFNVSKRGNETEVVLNSGKIALHMESREDVQALVVDLKPGDLVAYNKSKQTYSRKLVNPELYSSWKSSKLIFNKTALKEVLDILTNTYGLKITIDDPELMQMKISGSAPTKNADLLIGALAEILHVKFTRNGNSLMITSK